MACFILTVVVLRDCDVGLCVGFLFSNLGAA